MQLFHTSVKVNLPSFDYDYRRLRRKAHGIAHELLVFTHTIFDQPTPNDLKMKHYTDASDILLKRAFQTVISTLLSLSYMHIVFYVCI